MYDNVQERGFAEPISSENGEGLWSPENRCWHTGRPVKNDDFGGVFNPLAGKRFCVTENISSNGKHNLLGHYGPYDKDLEELFRRASEMDNIVLNYLREVERVMQYPPKAFRSCRAY